MARGKYTVNEVEERSKVPASTLRQWERRYGFPKPERSDSGYRLYSDADIHDIEAMKRHIADGIPASRAAELVRRVTAPGSGPRSLEQMRTEFVEALTALDEARAEALLSEAHALHPVEAVMQEVIGKGMVDIGELWHRSVIRSTTEHLASSYVQGRLRALIDLTPNPRGAPMVIVACAPGDHHQIGALMLAVLLRRNGYRTYYVGADTPLDDLNDMAASLKPTAVLISASLPASVTRLQEERDALARLARTSGLLGFGGSAFNARPELADELGGTFLGRDADEGVERLFDLVTMRLETS